MADRSGAEIFGTVFQIISGDLGLSREELAARVWREIKNYDFTEDQMGVDDALVELDLAKREPDPDDPDYTVIRYANENGDL